ncbi:MAG: DUF4296 domain-containing protein [Balneolaceae bacterium]
MQKSLLFLSIILASLFLSCDEPEIVPKPGHLIPEDTYVKLMVELQLLDAMVYTSEDSINTDSLITEIYSYYNTSREAYVASHFYYQSAPNKHLARIDSALKAIEREQIRLSQSN